MAGSGARLSAWLRHHDPGLVAVRRAARVTVAACVGFFACLYLLDDTTTAVYALFAAVALGALSDVAGTPAQRTRTYAAALAAGVVLVALGTALAGSTAAAAVGMLLVGFAVSFAGVGGPRVAGVANGLLLFYVLPCFPPYALDELGERLAGLVVGAVLLAVADRVLWPPTTPPDPERRVASGVEDVAAYARGLAAAMRVPPGATAAMRVPPGATAATADLKGLRTAAARAGAGLRLSSEPVAQRPSGPGRRDRSLTRASAEVRVLAGRLADLEDQVLGRVAAPAATAALVSEVGRVLDDVRGALDGGGPPPTTATLDDALAGYVDRRVRALAGGAGQPPHLRAGLTAVAAGESARTLVLVTAGVTGAPVPGDVPADLDFLRAGPAQLWWHRLRAHLTPRSVYLQNAVRLAVGLAAARVVAGVLDLAHGFWVLLATLVLMRTSAVAGRRALVPAFAGTVVGALVAGVLLVVAGADTRVYAVALPLLMVVTFAAGPVLGPAAGQAGFTVVVAVIFAQVAPATWRLAEARLVDVVVGGVVGAVIGAAVWPRGGGGEIRRVAAEGLRAGADEVVATVAAVAGGTAADPGTAARLNRLATLFEHTYAQYRSEPGSAPGGRAEPDWLVVLVVVRRTASYARALRLRHPPRTSEAVPDPDAAGLVDGAADVARSLHAVADAAAAGRTLSAADVPGPRERAAVDVGAGMSLRALDVLAWLEALHDDARRAARALDPPRTVAAPSPDVRPGEARASRRPRWSGGAVR